mgnify:CR=1 FL=1
MRTETKVFANGGGCMGEPVQTCALRKLVFNVPTRRELTIGERAITHGLAVAKGVRICRDVANMPPNVCNPAYLASQARRLADAGEIMLGAGGGEEFL